MLRLVITAALVGLMAWATYALLQRLVLAALVVMMLALSGCSFCVVPARPRIYGCRPVNSWKCSPNAAWSDM